MFSGLFPDLAQDVPARLLYNDFGDEGARGGRVTRSPKWDYSGRFDLNGREQNPQTDMMPGKGMLAASHIYTKAGAYQVRVAMHNDEHRAEPFNNLASMDIEVVDATVLKAEISSEQAVDQGKGFPLDITVTNLKPEAGWAGATATGTELKIRVPDGLEIRKLDPGCRKKQRIVCPLGDLRPGQQATVSLKARIARADAEEQTAYELELETFDGGPKVTERSISQSGVRIADADDDGVFDVDDAFPDDARWSADSDGDGLADAWELSVGLDPDVYDDPSTDVDADGRNLLREFETDAYPLLADIETLAPSAPLSASAPAGEDRYGQALAGADFDRDGYADTVIAAPLHGGRGKVYVAYGAGEGEPSRTQELNPAPGQTYYGKSVAAGDREGTGYPDLAIAHSGGVAIRYNHGQLYDVADVTLTPPGNATGFCGFLYSGDLDRDGADDLLVPYLTDTR